jgi:hypothetical protein
MTVEVPERRRLALDADWVTAIGMLALAVICALLVCGIVVSFSRPLRPAAVTWQTWLLFAYLAWGFVAVEERIFQIAAILLAVDPFSRILLSLFHASLETQLTNAWFTRWAELIVCIAGFIYVIKWFHLKVRHV